MNANVLRKITASFLALAASLSAMALEVNRGEIQSAGNSGEIVFRNYSGPHSVINSVQQIREIGSSLGNSVGASPTRSGTVGAMGRYAVIHAVDSAEAEKFDADIFIIGEGATVDHIRNLRHIISAYLSSAYGYSTRDADTLATFVTVYNAVYRGNADYFKSRYKDVVMRSLSPSIVGLSTNYEDWPGKTQIVIPLSDLSGGLSAIDTSLITDKDVVKSMQEDDDKGIDARKDMVDLKEREADSVQEKADAAQEKADAEKDKLAEEQKMQAEADEAASQAKEDAGKARAEADEAQRKADDAKQRADDAKKEADEAKKNAAADPNDADARKKADEARQNADEAKKEADDAQKNADEAKKEADAQAERTEAQAEAARSAQAEADRIQEQADQKRSEAQEERASIAKDQQTLIAESANNNDGSIMYGLKNIDDAGLTSAIIKMNSQTGRIIKESPVTHIRGRTAYDDGDNFIAVAGANSGNSAVRLVLINKQNLEMVKESAERLSETSVLVERDGSYYCTVQDGNDFYIGKFNNNIENLLKSKIKVKAATPITITAEGILVNDAGNTPVILSPRDLSSISPES